jgi:hypothetical protein|tara:strand:+ start:313 stop:642 length:330 start_codon:yes stop_codon:yes gene_type:complete
VQKNNIMDIKDYLNIDNIKNSELIQIKPFVIGFTCFSLISIWASDAVHSNLKEIKELKQKSKFLKIEHVAKRTHMMALTQRSYLLKKATLFELFPPTKPLKHINITHEY